MKPIFKLFGYGVYRVDSIETGVSLWQTDLDFTRITLNRIERVKEYLSTLKGKRRRASADKIERLLKG